MSRYAAAVHGVRHVCLHHIWCRNLLEIIKSFDATGSHRLALMERRGTSFINLITTAARLDMWMAEHCPTCATFGAMISPESFESFDATISHELVHMERKGTSLSSPTS